MTAKSLSFRKIAGAFAVCGVLGFTALVSAMPFSATVAEAAGDERSEYSWDSVTIGGGGFVSGIVTGKKAMYARTDVGGAYRYDYANDEWVQLMSFVNEADRGFLSVDAMCIDPTDDNTIYLLCGCAYFSDERTAVFKSTDGGKTFTEHDVSDLIKVHGNGYGRQCGEAIAVDPDNPDIIYCGGDTDGLIMSKDGGETWGYVDSFNDLGLFTNEVKWPTWKDIVKKTTVGSDYTSCNGIATIAIQDGKVFVGVSDNTIGANVYVADVGKDNWKPLSDDLPTDSFPSRINKDSDGNLLICYVGGLSFNGTGGGIYKYDIKADTVTDISPTGNSFGGCVSLPDDSNTLVATTCGVWSSQLWYKGAWEDDKVSWGDQFYRSTDGGKTWEGITPGNEKSWNGPLQADYLKDGGYKWINNKAIHWCGAIVLDPTDSDRIFLTSGNGVFSCDNIWDELPQYYFHPDGIEEVVALDMVSVPGGDEYSAIGDYDGFIHTDLTKPGQQYEPNIGSTSAIAYCPAAPEYMVRLSNNNSDGYLSKDNGQTWEKMPTVPASGAKAALTQLADGTIRIFVTENGTISYSDDFGSTWKSSSGLDASKSVIACVDLENPKYVYAYTAKYNEYWASNPNNKEPSLEDAHYSFMVSDDYGATFKSTTVCAYDMCDVANRIGYLAEGEMVVGAGWNGAYRVSDYGSKIEKLDSVFYCKTIGYGAAEKEGGLNTLYMYGKPAETDEEGVYRSTDGGKTWDCINTDSLYGGTGNGNFLVGDMNEFGRVYMSTVGCGIIYGELSGTTPVDPEVTTTTTSKETEATTTSKEPDKTTSTTKTTEVSESGKNTATTTSSVKPTLLGDVNVDGAVDVRDVTLMNQYIVKMSDLTEQGYANGDVISDGTVDLKDLGQLKKYLIKVITSF